MYKIVLYVHDQDSSSQILEFIHEHIFLDNLFIQIITVIDIQETQMAFLSLNNAIIHDYHQTAKKLLNYCSKKVQCSNNVIEVKTKIIEGKAKEVILQHLKQDPEIRQIILGSKQEKKHGLINYLLTHNIIQPITIVPN